MLIRSHWSYDWNWMEDSLIEGGADYIVRDVFNTVVGAIKETVNLGPRRYKGYRRHGKLVTVQETEEQVIDTLYRLKHHYTVVIGNQSVDLRLTEAQARELLTTEVDPRVIVPNQASYVYTFLETGRVPKTWSQHVAIS